MATNNNNTTSIGTKNSGNDLPDSEHDKLEMQESDTFIDLPDVKDIPGQENITVPDFREFADTTIASDGEEGVSVFGKEEDDESNVSATERTLLHKSATESLGADDDIKSMALDNTDEDGAPLNEGNLNKDHFGEDLDMPEDEEIDDDNVA